MNGIVYMDNDSPLTINRICDIRLRMFDGVIRTIEYWHVPYIKRNLIFLLTLDSQGYRFHAENNILKMYKDSMVFMKDSLKFRLYVLWENIVSG